jgi:hypothetical protein
MWWLLPAVRKQKEKSQSRLYGLLEAIGIVLSELKDTILTVRLRRYFLIRDDNHPYYNSDLRTEDLDLHALDRGLRRLPGESDAILLERIATLGYRSQFLGTKAGMKYLVEEIYGLTCEQIVEYYVDDQSWIVLSAEDQAGEAEVNISRIFSADDVDIYEAYRQTRIYSEDDLSLAFHFWMHVSFPQGLNVDQQVVIEAINAQKPAHTRAVVHFTEDLVPVV